MPSAVMSFSPRTRRCFYDEDMAQKILDVFSAYAEVFLDALEDLDENGCFLRVRGGVSILSRSRRSCKPFSPRTRRCFYAKTLSPKGLTVFSAYAEVFPRRPNP